LPLWFYKEIITISYTLIGRAKKERKKYRNPSDTIDKHKISFYKDAVEGYLELYPCELEIRFDAINVIIGKEETEIEHIANTF
jgi:Holliday junction resolvase-like predicted endonuclease